MSRKYKRITSDIDPERGNAVTIYREDVAPLVRQLPTEVTAPIIDAFIRWFCNVAEPEIKDAIARALLEQFKERQREAVKGYIAVCNSRSPNKPMDEDGETQVETSTHKPLNKENKKNEDNKVKSSVLFGGKATPTDGDSTPTASPSSADVGSVISKDDVIEARSTMARYAPEPKFVLAFDPSSSYQPECINCAKYCDGERRQKCKQTAAKGKPMTNCANLDESFWIDARAQAWRDHLTYGDKYRDKQGNLAEEDFWFDYSKQNYSDIDYNVFSPSDGYCCLQQLLDERFDNTAYSAVERFRDTLGETFDRAVWTFYIQKNARQLPEKDKDGNATNYGKLLFGRLKKLVKAKAILDQADATRPRITSTTPRI